MNIFPLILLSVLINTAAQLLLKEGISRIGYFSYTIENFWPIVSKIIVNPYIIAGMTCYVGSVGVWLMVLSRTEVSYAYPISSLGYVFTALAGYLLLNESMSLSRIAGILIIMCGVFLVTRS